MADILVAEDYKSTRTALRMLLKSAGHEVRLAADGDEAMRFYREKRPDLLLLDVMMPKKSGYQVLADIRRTDPSLPVILLTAKSEKSDIMLGLGLGSDDYVTKPFDDDLLLARISAALRRAEMGAPAAAPAEPAVAPRRRPAGLADEVFRFGRHTVDVRRLKLIGADGAETPLQLREVTMLQFFASHPDEGIDREEFISLLWGDEYCGTQRSIDQAVMRLRAKLGEDGNRIVAVWGVGYRYET